MGLLPVYVTYFNSWIGWRDCELFVSSGCAEFIACSLEAAGEGRRGKNTNEIDERMLNYSPQAVTCFSVPLSSRDSRAVGELYQQCCDDD